MSKTRFGSLDGVHKIKKNGIFSGMGISVAIFMVALLLFLYAVSFASKSTTQEQKSSLSNAIDRCMLQCYVTEGRYPESFDYLVNNYGIYYDSTKYRVDYVGYGCNMKPDVTIIELEADY